MVMTATVLCGTVSGRAEGEPVRQDAPPPDAVPERLAAFQRDVDSTPPSAYELFRAAGPDCPENVVRQTHRDDPGLKRYDEAFDKVMAEVQSTSVTGAPAVWLVYNMGVVVKTPKAVFAIDLAHRKGLLAEPLLDFALVTHNHDDHVDETLLATMDRHRKTVVSNFMCNYGAHKRGTTPGGYSRGERTLQIADATIRVTPSDHNDYLREFTSAFEIAVGDWTLYHSGDSFHTRMLNPTREPDLWICHPHNGIDIADCVRKFRPKRTVVAHLDELGHEGTGRIDVRRALDDAARIEPLGTEAVLAIWGDRIQ